MEIEDGVIYHKTEYRERRDHFAYFACSEKLAGFDTQRESFLALIVAGTNRPWSSAENPANSIAHGWAPIGSHHVKVDLKPGESQQIIFVLGYQENPSDREVRSAGFPDRQQEDGEDRSSRSI